MEKETNINYIFPIAIGEYDVSFFNKKILFNIIKNSPLGKHKLLKKGVNSYDRLPLLHLPELKELKDYFQECINSYSNRFNLGNLKLDGNWFNLMETNGQTLTHDHSGSNSILSGAYYPLLHKDSCNLTFISPYRNEEFTLNLKENYLYIFPSWLKHKTDVNKGPLRITLSFNAPLLHS